VRGQGATVADRPVGREDFAAGFRPSRERPASFRLRHNRRCIRCNAVVVVVVVVVVAAAAAAAAVAVGAARGGGDGGCGSTGDAPTRRRRELARCRRRRRRLPGDKLPECRPSRLSA